MATQLETQAWEDATPVPSKGWGRLLAASSQSSSYGISRRRNLVFDAPDLVKDEYVIGRRANADIVIVDAAISNIHCKIYRVRDVICLLIGRCALRMEWMPTIWLSFFMTPGRSSTCFRLSDACVWCVFTVYMIMLFHTHNQVQMGLSSMMRELVFLA